MQLQPRLIPVHVPARPRGAVLLLHGGGSRARSARVSPTQLSVLRMIPVAQRVARAGRGELAVFRLLNSWRGWDSRHTPVQDVAWAMGRVRSDHGDLPTCLVGHSLGGRAALLSGVQEGVRGVVALNAWVYPDDRADLRGRRVLFVHGTADRIADPRRAATVAKALGRTTQVSYLSVPDGQHGMLRHHGVFDRYAAQFATGVLLGSDPGGPVGRALSGERWIEL